MLPIAALFGACGGGGAKPVSTDAGVADGALEADGAAGEGGLDVLPSGATVAAPMLPAPPTLTPCPDGWRTVTMAPGEPAVCEPWPASGYESCPAAQAHLPGTPGCAPVGDACPTGSFRDDFPAGAHVLYVQAGASSGGDGTEAAPFATIADATAAATPGTIIALAAGDYDEAVVLRDGVELWGTCAAQTHLTVTTPAFATVTLLGTGTAVRDVSISGDTSGLVVEGRAAATIDGVAIEGATTAGMEVRMDGQATLDDVVIRDTQTSPTDHFSAWGLLVDTGGRVVASRLAVERCGFGGVGAYSAGSSLMLADSVVADTKPVDLAYDAMHVTGFGIITGGGATSTLDRVVVERATFAGITAGSGGRVDGSSVLVRDTRPNTGPFDRGYGVEVQASGTVHLERSRLVQSVGVAAGALGSDAGVELIDSIVEDTAANASGYDGFGGSATGGGSVSLTRVLVRRCETDALIATDAGSKLDLTDVAATDTRPQPTDHNGADGLYLDSSGSATVQRVLIDGASLAGIEDLAPGSLTGTDLTVRNVGPTTGSAITGIGVGLSVESGAQVDLTRLAISHATGLGMIVYGASTKATVHDLRIESTAPAAADFSYASMTRLGRALEVQTGATADIERAVLAENHETAIDAVDVGTSLMLGDVVVRDMRSEVTTNGGGSGIEASLGAHVTVAGARIERTRAVAVASYGMGTAISLSDVDILDTAENACAADTCADTSAGFGMVSSGGASLTATRFLVTRSALCGVQVAMDGGLDLDHGEVSYNQIGANVQVTGFDIQRISNSVAYDHNQSNLDSDVLPVPAPVADVPLMRMPGSAM